MSYAAMDGSATQFAGQNGYMPECVRERDDESRRARERDDDDDARERARERARGRERSRAVSRDRPRRASDVMMTSFIHVHRQKKRKSAPRFF